MEKRQLGHSQLALGVLGMGCWQFGGGTYWGPQSQADVDRVVHEAIDQGINYFDTAEAYNDGQSEISLGQALKKRRHQVIIGSKFSPSHARPEDLLRHCEESLKRLQTEYLDLYMLHWPLNGLAIRHFTANDALIAAPPAVDDVWQTLVRLQEEGKIRHIGISNHGVQQMSEIRDAGFTFTANELAYNLLSRAIEAHILPSCIRHQTGVIAYMPLQQGLLTGKYERLSQIRPMQARSRHFPQAMGSGSRHGESGAMEEIEHALAGIRQIADEQGVSVIALSLAWVIAHRSVTTTIVGCRNVAQLRSNVEGASLQLSPDVIQALDRLTEPVLQKLGDNPDYYEHRERSRII